MARVAKKKTPAATATSDCNQGWGKSASKAHPATTPTAVPAMRWLMRDTVSPQACWQTNNVVSRIQ
ncbi:hypothetical protein GmRootV213_57380 (plasmid) [Variovorax sp. V213]